MKTTSATVRSGRTIPHPLRAYANIKTEIELGVLFDDSDDVEKEIEQLRIRAEQLVHTHQEQVSESIRRGEEMETTTNRIAELEAELKKLREKQTKHQSLLFAHSEVKDYSDDRWDDD